MSLRSARVLFRFILSVLMCFTVSGIATFRNVRLLNRFRRHWIDAWLPSWHIAFPSVLAVAPLARRPVGMLVIASTVQVR